MPKVKKAIIAVAGLGTRFLPATKVQPKEMLPVVDKPILQYVVEEAVNSGIEEIIFVTSTGKRAIEDHFDYSYELMDKLEKKGKFQLLEEITKITQMATFAYVRQPEALGDGHAIMQARHLIGDEPVAVMFGDDIISNDRPCLQQLIDIYEKNNAPVLALQEVPIEDVSSYGVIGGDLIKEGAYKLSQFVEKPEPAEAPSNLSVVGRYILTPEVFSYLENTDEDSSGEIRLAGAFTRMLQQGKDIYGCQFRGKRYDCGNKLGFLKATIDYGLRHPEVKDALQEYLEEICLNQKK